MDDGKFRCRLGKSDTDNSGERHCWEFSRWLSTLREAECRIMLYFNIRKLSGPAWTWIMRDKSLSKRAPLDIWFHYVTEWQNLIGNHAFLVLVKVRFVPKRTQIGSMQLNTIDLIYQIVHAKTSELRDLTGTVKVESVLRPPSNSGARKSSIFSSAWLCQQSSWNRNSSVVRRLSSVRPWHNYLWT